MTSTATDHFRGMPPGRDAVAVRVLIADDHELVRDLVAGFLAAQEGTQVTTAGSLDRALELVRAAGGYDIVLLDLAMPGMSGLDGLRRMLAANAGGRVVMFSGLARRETVAEGLEMGAAGFIPKDLPARSLVNAIRFVLSGETYLPSSYLSDGPDPGAESGTGLTPKERAVLRGIRSGWMNKQIAHQMGLSEVTVKMHVRSICRKLNARNRTHAAIIANSLALD